MNKNLLLGAGVFIAVILVGVFLVSRPNTQTSSQVSASPEVTTKEEGVDEGEVGGSTEGSVREVMVSASEYSFNPSSLTFKKGEKIRLTLKNVGSMPHDFVIDELGVRTKTIPRGKSDTVEFSPDEEGTFTFYCSVSNHRSLGMEGEVKVE